MILRRARIVLLAVVCSSAAAAGELGKGDERPLAEQAYAGLLCSDHAETGGMVVGWILPGPLKGQTFKSPFMNRGDLILAVNGQPMGKKAFKELVERSKPGDVLTLRVRRTKGDENASPAVPGKGMEETAVRLALASRADWVGPIAFRRPPPDPDKVLPPGPTPLEKFLGEQIAKHVGAALRGRPDGGAHVGAPLPGRPDGAPTEGRPYEPIDKLLKYLADTQTEEFGANSLSRVAAGFYRPTRLPELQKLITDPLGKVPGDPREVFLRAAENLDLPPPPLGEPADLSDPAKAIAWMKAHLAEAARLRDQAFAAIPPQRQKSLARDLAEVLDHEAKEHYLMSHPDAGRLLAALRESMKVDHAALLAAGAKLAGVLRPGKPPAPGLPTIRIPRALRGAVEGDILAAEKIDGRWIVYGGFGPNRYDLSKIDVVIDPGGDDAYFYSSEERPAIQVVVDFAGNDRYESKTAGPASALLGISILVDVAGNDRYEGRTRACGVGVMGVGILCDLGGADVYTGGTWSLGVGVYGFGAILDLGGEADTYIAEYLSEGVGGPRGFGLLLDAGGNDLYRANGPKGSVYDTPAVFAAFSQGMGFGFRMCESGGIGVLCDLGGDDRYEAGEFAQGGGYYWGLGILYDRSGNDLYYGNRYGQGFGCHQAIGILADDAGDDTYWAMCAACQGAAWDIAMGLLIDRGGNDSYQAEGLCQGSAAMQAIGWLIDLDGTDRYVARGEAVHGCSAGNSYHYKETGCFSWSLLLDAGGTADHYSSGRPNGASLAPGKLDEKNPENSPLHGLFVDTPEKRAF